MLQRRRNSVLEKTEREAEGPQKDLELEQGQQQMDW